MSFKSISKSIFEYIFVFSIVINAGSQYVHMMVSSANLIVFIVLVFSGIGIIFSSKIRIDKISKASKIILFLSIYFSVYLLFQKIGRKDLIENLIAILIIFLVMYLCYTRENPRLLFVYRNIIIVVAIISMFFWLFGSILQIIKPTGLVMSSWTGENGIRYIPSYFGIYFETQMTLFHGWNIQNFIRNSAIYAESPLASLNFCLALAINLFLEKKPSQIKNIILILAILSTTSATGIFILFICLLGKILLSRKKNKINLFIKAFWLPIILVITIVITSIMFKQKMSVNSGFLRIDDFIAGFKAWMVNPLFGSGFGNAQTLFQNVSYSRMIRNQLGISNSTAIILSQGGLYLMLPYILCYIQGIIRDIKNKRYNYLIVYIIFLILLNCNVVPYLYLTFLMLIWIA